ncbi:methyltransferase, FxLD system [Saccharomonospora iraqiensis]|uniref:methyltransferase, FxLD system n=1 Tax=Saccharomonospora iraqiensis TaxID=52698 RepID=UPI00047CA58D|nr:methyltransferase, FxLD system [Saccharomonospora iraqiensis]
MTTVYEAGSGADDAAARREAMVRELQEWGDLRSGALTEAVRAVPRHLFAPEEPLENVYAANRALVTKRDGQGLATSSLSATHIQVTMLEQAQLEPGMRVLEVGSGGYNAALIAELVGESGTVVSLDIDRDIVERARGSLDAAGYGRVTVALGDAEHGYTAGAPFDRIIVTAGAWDIPPAWWEQLAPGGRLIVPLRMRGLTRSVVLERDGAHLVSTGYRLCGFVPMQGSSAREQRLIPLEGAEVALRVEEEQLLDIRGLQKSLQSPRLERWPGIEFDRPDETHFWIATAAPVFGLLAARHGAIDRGLVARSTQQGVPTLIRGASFAYRTKRPIEGTDSFENGVYAHGPEADAVAHDYVELLRRFDRDLRGGPGAHIKVFPAATPTSELPRGRVTEKRHTRVVVSWPERENPDHTRLS